MKMACEFDGVRIVEITAPFGEICRFQLQYPPLEPGKPCDVTTVTFTWNSPIGDVWETLQERAQELKRKVAGNG